MQGNIIFEIEEAAKAWRHIFECCEYVAAQYIADGKPDYERGKEWSAYLRETRDIELRNVQRNGLSFFKRYTTTQLLITDIKRYYPYTLRAAEILLEMIGDDSNEFGRDILDCCYAEVGGSMYLDGEIAAPYSGGILGDVYAMRSLRAEVEKLRAEEEERTRRAKEEEGELIYIEPLTRLFNDAWESKHDAVIPSEKLKTMILTANFTQLLVDKAYKTTLSNCLFIAQRQNLAPRAWYNTAMALIDGKYNTARQVDGLYIDTRSYKPEGEPMRAKIKIIQREKATRRKAGR